MRNGWKIGDYLVVDDESGIEHYASDCVIIWDGSLRHKSNTETRNPQEFVRAKNDPYPLKDARPAVPTSAAVNAQPVLIGNTNIPFPSGPGAHLYDLAIPDMAIGTTFVVR